MQGKTKFNHIAIQVKDLEESGRFYEEVLELKLIPEPFRDGLHLWFEIGENLSLHLIKSEAPLILPGKDTHFCYSMTDLDAFMKRLDALDVFYRSEEHTSELQSRENLVCRLLLEKKKKIKKK